MQMVGLGSRIRRAIASNGFHDSNVLVAVLELTDCMQAGSRCQAYRKLENKSALSLDLVNQLPHRLLEFSRSDCYCEETLTSKLVNLANHDGVGVGPQNDPRIRKNGGGECPPQDRRQVWYAGFVAALKSM